jgi:hypothetical protein
MLARNLAVAPGKPPHDALVDDRRDRGDVAAAKRREELADALRVGMRRRHHIGPL